MKRVREWWCHLHPVQRGGWVFFLLGALMLLAAFGLPIERSHYGYDKEDRIHYYVFVTYWSAPEWLADAPSWGKWDIYYELPYLVPSFAYLMISPHLLPL